MLHQLPCHFIWMMEKSRDFERKHRPHTIRVTRVIAAYLTTSVSMLNRSEWMDFITFFTCNSAANVTCVIRNSEFQMYSMNNSVAIRATLFSPTMSVETFHRYSKYLFTNPIPMEFNAQIDCSDCMRRPFLYIK